MSRDRDAQKALQEGRRKLEAATNGVKQLVKEVDSGALLCRSPAEDALRRRRDVVAEYKKLTRALTTATASLADALAALDNLDRKVMESSR